MIVVVEKENCMLIIKNMIKKVLMEWMNTDTQMKKIKRACLIIDFHLMYEGKGKTAENTKTRTK